MNRQRVLIIAGIFVLFFCVLFGGFRLLMNTRTNREYGNLAQNTSLRNDLKLPMQSEQHEIPTITNEVLNTSPEHELIQVDESDEDRELAQNETIRIIEDRIQRIDDGGKIAQKQLFRMREQLRLIKMKTELETLEDWTDAYNGRVYSVPIEIDIEADAPYKFNSPEETLAAFWRAQFSGDVDALFSMSDEQAKELLRTHYSLEPGKKMPYAFDGATQMSILMRGELDVGNEHYVLLYIRRISKNAPNGIISLQSTIVKRAGDRYLITELPRMSAFANIDSVVGIKCYPYGPYKTLLPKLQESRLPESFFRLEP